MQLEAEDADLPPNAGPFNFKLIQGSDKVELDEPTGTLRSKLVYDRERIPDFRVKVQIRDSGSPPQTAVGNIKVEVLDENDNPSEPRNMNVVIKTFEGVFPGGRVADVRPTDPDLKGEYSCKLLRGAESIFRVEPDCQVSEEGFTRVALTRAHGPQTHATFCGLGKDRTLLHNVFKNTLLLQGYRWPNQERTRVRAPRGRERRQTR